MLASRQAQGHQRQRKIYLIHQDLQYLRRKAKSDCVAPTMHRLQEGMVLQQRLPAQRRGEPQESVQKCVSRKVTTAGVKESPQDTEEGSEAGNLTEKMKKMDMK